MSITEILRQRIIDCFDRGDSKSLISRKFGVSRSTVRYTLNRYNQTNSLRDRQRTGRPRLFSERFRRLVCKLLILRRCTTTTQALLYINNNLQINISLSQIQRIVHQQGLEYKALTKKHNIDAKIARTRLAFAREHLNWSVDEWKSCIFADESIIEANPKNYKLYEWRKIGANRYQRVDRMRRYPGRKYNFWSCVTSAGVGLLAEIDGNLTGQQYTEILRDQYSQSIQYFDGNVEEYILVHDNSPCHTALIAKRYLRNNHIGTLFLPQYSPDINIIENLWGILKKKVKNYMYNHPRADLMETICELWEETDLNIIDHLYESLPTRMQAIIDANGWWTKY